MTGKDLAQDDLRGHLSELAKATQRIGQLHLSRAAALRLEQPRDCDEDATHRARDVATFSRFRLYRNSIPRGASSGRDVAIE